MKISTDVGPIRPQIIPKIFSKNSGQMLLAAVHWLFCGVYLHYFKWSPRTWHITVIFLGLRLYIEGVRK